MELYEFLSITRGYPPSTLPKDGVFLYWKPEISFPSGYKIDTTITENSQKFNKVVASVIYDPQKHDMVRNISKLVNKMIDQHIQKVPFLDTDNDKLCYLCLYNTVDNYKFLTVEYAH